MKFLIIGASGYIGEYCYHFLKSNGYPVVGTRFNSINSELIPFDLSKDMVSTVVNSSFFTGNEKIFAVIFAAFSQVERCFREKEESYKVNVEGTIRILKDLTNYGITPIYISTSSVYDGLTGNYDENSSRNPQTEYGRQKLTVEKFIEQNIPQALILRLDKIVGDKPARRNPFFEWHKLIERKQPILCLDNIISPTFIEDIVQSIIICCEKGFRGSLNLASSEIFRREELVRQFSSALQKRSIIKLISEKELNFLELRPPKTFLNSNKFIKATGFNFTPMHEVFARFKNNLKDEQYG